jgi:hypothetical protein
MPLMIFGATLIGFGLFAVRIVIWERTEPFQGWGEVLKIAALIAFIFALGAGFAWVGWRLRSGQRD